MITVNFGDGINDYTTENLYQWDINQVIKISGINFGSTAPKIHFCNKKSDVAFVIDASFTSNNSVQSHIPNELLQEKYDILAYIYVTDGSSSRTIRTIRIPIEARLKPVNYSVPTNEQIAQIEEIELEAKVILNGLYASNYSNSESYKRPNIVFYQNASYMCNSNTAITGVLPTDTSKWQLLCYGSVVTSVNKSANGNLEFIFDNGNTYEIPIAVVNATTNDTIHASTADSATTADRANYLNTYDYTNNIIGDDSNNGYGYVTGLNTTGLYAINFEVPDDESTINFINGVQCYEQFTVLISLDDFTNRFIGTHSYNGSVNIKVYNDGTTIKISNGNIVSCKLLIAY